MPKDALLWIHAKPGAGKTILSSFLVEHYQSEYIHSGNVFYFCKNTDADKNSPVAVIRSLLYQFYKSAESQDGNDSLSSDLDQAIDASGQHKAVNLATMLGVFSAHIGKILPSVIVLDALDECQDPESLIQGLKSLKGSVKVIVTSRKESQLDTELRDNVSIEIMPEDVDTDIVAFIESKILASRTLSHHLVRSLVLTRLSNTHGGMFLWVYLILKELKSCISVAQVQDTLDRLPKGLDGIYQNILQRLQNTLSISSFDLCVKVLTWVVSALVQLSFFRS